MLHLRTIPPWHQSALTALALLILGACTYDFEAPFAQTPTGGVGGAGGAGGDVGGADGGTAGTGGAGGTGGSSCANPPAAPTGPTPADGATDVDSTTLSAVDWDDVDGAAGYDVYLSEACPPPAYPNGGFQSVSASELGGLSLSDGLSYCWQVVALGSVPGCYTAGPQWTFETAGICSDPSPGPPTVTSVDASYAAGTTSDTYTLTFSEGVTGIYGHVSWTPVAGNGAMGTLTAVDGSTFTVPFSGTSDSDRYTLTVGSGVSDVCGNALGAPVDINILIHNDGGLDCQEPADLLSESYYVGSGNRDCWAIAGDPQDTADDYDFACDPGTGGDVVIQYTTGPNQTTLNFDATIANYEPMGYIGLEINDGPCMSGTTLYCEGDGGPSSGPTDGGSIPVSPSSTYFVWVADAFSSHHRPDVDICLW